MKHLLKLTLVLFVSLAFIGCDSNDDEDNNAPTATADAATAVEGAAVTIDVLANDTDPDGDDLTITEVSGTSNGETEIEDGAIVYTADAGFSGQDTFTYTVSDGDNTATGTVVVNVTLQVVGEWVSEGEDLGQFLVDLFGTERVTATFNADGTYNVFEERTDGSTVEYDGTYTASVPGVGDIREITLDQDLPFDSIAEGIYEIDLENGTMTYEVAQTTPDIGATPPTPEGGFGSTVAPNFPAGYFTQSYDLVAN